MKRVGIIAEGTNDQILLENVLSGILGDDTAFLNLQPEPDASGAFGNGWKGVWKWCESHAAGLTEYFYSITPNLDLLVIHMDGDVARCEKEVHCQCQRENCGMPNPTHPLSCAQIKDATCPVVLPCSAHDATPEAYAAHLRAFIKRLLQDQQKLPICLCIPCDSMDTWIVAAYDDLPNYEMIVDPWIKMIAHSAHYHGIRIKNRPKKNTHTYAELSSILYEKWDTVCSRCPQAARFNQEIKHALMQGKET